MALDGGIVVDGPLIIFESFGEVEGQPVEVRRPGRGVLDGDAIPALALHQGPVAPVIHDGDQNSIIRMHNIGRLEGW